MDGWMGWDGMDGWMDGMDLVMLFLSYQVSGEHCVINNIF
jgi:hypothetical protein